MKPETLLNVREGSELKPYLKIFKGGKKQNFCHSSDRTPQGRVGTRGSCCRLSPAWLEFAAQEFAARGTVAVLLLCCFD